MTISQRRRHRHARFSLRRSGVRGWCAVAAAALPLMVTGVQVAAAPTVPADVQPHRAVYTMELARLQANSDVTQAEGRFEFEWRDLCRGWQITQRTRLEVAYRDGQVVDFGWALKSWEAKDGRSYRFIIDRTGADGLTERVRGEAELTAEGGTARFLEPEPYEVELPPETIFPTQHSLELLEAAQRDELPLWRWVFTGSGDDGLFGIFAALIKEMPPDAPVALDSELLRDQRSWRVQLGFFNREEDGGPPDQEQALRVFANGVVDALELDYGDFGLTATLVELEALPADC